MFSLLAFALLCQIHIGSCSPVPAPLRTQYFDVQGHRGGRGNTVENTLPSFAWGLIDGSTTLELDNGITKDGVVVVWHDENIVPEKCKDIAPAFQGDQDFPYVGKFIVNLTLAQIKTLDCGSERQADFPLQLTYPGTKISTLEQVLAFAECADPQHEIQWNIESKIDAVFPNLTSGPGEFVEKQHAIFVSSPYRRVITFQSFDWRSLIAMKALDPRITTSALISPATATLPDNSTTPWLAGLRLDDFHGSSLGEQIANAAHSIGADILSPSAEAAGIDPTIPGYVPFTTREMVERSHVLGMLVKPWTVDRLNIAEQLLDWHVDGIITDFPNMMRRWIQQQGLPVAPKYPKRKVLQCLEQHLERV